MFGKYPSYHNVNVVWNHSRNAFLAPSHCLDQCLRIGNLKHQKHNKSKIFILEIHSKLSYEKCSSHKVLILHTMPYLQYGPLTSIRVALFSMMDGCADGPFGILNWMSVVSRDLEEFSPKPSDLHKTKLSSTYLCKRLWSLMMKLLFHIDRYVTLTPVAMDFSCFEYYIRFIIICKYFMYQNRKMAHDTRGINKINILIYHKYCVLKTNGCMSRALYSFILNLTGKPVG